MKRIIFLVAVFFSCLSFSESLDYSLAVKYLEVSKAQEMFNGEIDSIANQLSNGNPKREREMRIFFNYYMGWDTLKIPTIRLIQQAFTKQELTKVIEFYNTPEGKAYADKSVWLGNELSKIIITNLIKLMSKR